MTSSDLQEQSRLQEGLLGSAEILVGLRKRKLDSSISGSRSLPLLPEGIASVAGQTLPTNSHFKPIKSEPLAEGGSRLHLSSPECSAMKGYEAWRERCVSTSSSSSGGGGLILIRKDSQELEKMSSEESVDRRVGEDAWRWQTCRETYQAAVAIRSNATASHQMSIPTLTPSIHSSSSRHATPLLLPFLHRQSAPSLPALPHHQHSQPQEEPKRSDTPFPSSSSASLHQQIATTTSIPSLHHRPQQQQQQQKEETRRSDTPFPSYSSSLSHCINDKPRNPHRQESGSPRPLMAKPRPLWGQPEATSCSNATTTTTTATTIAITTTAASATSSCSSSNGGQQQQQRGGEEEGGGEGTGGEGGGGGRRKDEKGGGGGGEGTGGEGEGGGGGRRKDEKGGRGGGGDSRPEESKMNPVKQQQPPSRRARNTSNSSKRRRRSNSVSSSSRTPPLSFDGQSSSSSSQSHYHQHATRRNTSLQHNRNEEVEDGKDGQGRDDGMDVEEEGGVASDSKRQRKIGIYSPEARRKRLERFWEKRNHRVWHQEGVRYAVRKDFAETRVRVKGRFISKKEAASVSLPTIARPNPSASHGLEQEKDEEKDEGESIAAAAAAPCCILSDGNTFLLQKAVVLEQEGRKGDKSPVAAAKAVEGRRGFEEEKEKKEEEEEDEEEGDQKDRRLDAAKCLSGLRFSSTC